MTADQAQEVQVQAAGAELPLARVTIGGLEVSRGFFRSRVDVPASAPLVGYEGPPESRGHPGHEVGIVPDRPEPIRDGEVRALEIPQNPGEIMVGLLREDQVRGRDVGHVYDIGG